MAKNPWGAEKLARIDQQAKGAVEQDAAQAHRAEVLRETRSTMPVDRIKPRKADTRTLSAEHVEALVQSIAALGLIEPLAVDRHGRLLAGGHRIDAIRQLKSADREAYQRHFVDDLVPVRVLDFDADTDDELAWKIEVAENEKRRDYTPQEIQGFRERLLTLGFIEKEGRPKKGEEGKNLHPALAAVIGKSIRTVRRILGEGTSKASPSREADAKVLVRRLARSLDAYEAVSDELKGMDKVNAAVRDLRKLLSEALGES